MPAFVFRLSLAAAVFASGLTGAMAASSPRRIVSLNVCVDQILLDLVPRERIAALTHLATDPLTVPHPERARGIPQTRGAAEDVLAHDPDLILAGAYTTTASVALLKRLGRRVETVDQPQTVQGIRGLVRKLATLVDEPDRGAHMIAAFDARLAGLARQQRPTTALPPTAIVYQVNSFVSSTGSLIDEAIRLAGFRNGAADLSISRAGQVSLEALLAHPPDLLVLASAPQTYRSTAADNLRHPALAVLAPTTRLHVLPWQMWLCGTPHIADTIEQLAALKR